jgi:hypothetical protein
MLKLLNNKLLSFLHIHYANRTMKLDKNRQDYLKKEMINRKELKQRTSLLDSLHNHCDHY